MKLREFLLRLRADTGWSQAEAALKSGCSRRSLQTWEKGTHVPSARACVGLGEAYGVAPALLMTLATSAEIERLEGGA
jgi:transcriptional regulator with XRE-family HTH domain